MASKIEAYHSPATTQHTRTCTYTHRERGVHKRKQTSMGRGGGSGAAECRRPSAEGKRRGHEAVILRPAPLIHRRQSVLLVSSALPPGESPRSVERSETTGHRPPSLPLGEGEGGQPRSTTLSILTIDCKWAGVGVLGEGRHPHGGCRDPPCTARSTPC